MIGEIHQEASLSGVVSIPKIIHDGGSAGPATKETLGLIIVGENLNITEEGVLSVDVATAAEQDNTKPITSAAVNTLVGNIDALLSTI